MNLFGIDFTDKTEKQIIRALDNDGIETYNLFATSFDRYSKDGLPTEEQAAEKLKSIDDVKAKVFTCLVIFEECGADLTKWLEKKETKDKEDFAVFKSRNFKRPKM